MTDVGQPGSGFRMRWNEELTAVLVGDRGNLKSADPAGLVDDLLLVHADQRTEDRQVCRLPYSDKVFQRLRCHLAQTLPGDKRQRLFAARDALGDAQHHAAVKNYAQGPKDSSDDLPLNLSKRD